MKAAIYDPYLDTLGGGEKYSASVAKLLEDLGYEVDFWWPQDMTKKLFNRFAVHLAKPRFLDFSPIKTSLIDRLFTSAQYDLVFWVSDGSIPVSLAKKTIIHMQIPAHWQGCGTLANQVKIRFYTVACNSKFTKSVVDRVYRINSHVVYPPVAVELFQPLPKQNLIVGIGRLAHGLHSKRQDILIKAFSRLLPLLPDWRLVLAGGSKDLELLKNYRDLIRKLPIEIIPNPSLEKIKQLLGTAKFFWSATGFGVNPIAHPERMEHFGITTVEAMAAGAIPLVTNSGGHLETVVPGQSGYLWNSIDQLVKYTVSLSKDEIKLNKMASQAQARSKLFSTAVFNSEFSKLI
ncbi:MAG: glycosyltransferase [Patescibacteria group bacterium]